MPDSPDATSFAARLQQRIDAVDSLLCVGLDPTIDQLPQGIERSVAGVVEFCVNLIEATKDEVAIFKPNLGFFVGLGRRGLDALWEVRAAIPEHIPVLLDCKVNDMGATAESYARGWFDELDVDAITVSPYMGEDSLVPYLRDERRGVFVLCKTSNPGGGDFQDLNVSHGSAMARPLFLQVAQRCRDWDDRYPATVGLVVGATWPAQLEAVRSICPDQPILLPGLGAQGGDTRSSVLAGTTPAGTGLLCSASRSIMYASSGEDYADAARMAARDLRSEINSHRPRKETAIEIS
jgi:orotidine-5'-phosphate decarboxylase